MSKWTHHRSRIANLRKTLPADHPQVIEEQRAMRAARLEEHVAEVIAGAPPLTDEQRDRIAALLTAGGAA